MKFGGYVLLPNPGLFSLIPVPPESFCVDFNFIMLHCVYIFEILNMLNMLKCVYNFAEYLYMLYICIMLSRCYQENKFP